MPVDHPPLEPVSSIVAALEARGMRVAIGGSAVLAAHGLVDRVGDWDVTIDADPDAVAETLAELGLDVEDATSGEPPFATGRRLVVTAPDHTIDVLVGFALREAGERIPIPVRVGSRWLGLPIAHAEDWERAYRLLGRAERAESLARRSADASDWMGA